MSKPSFALLALACGLAAACGREHAADNAAAANGAAAPGETAAAQATIAEGLGGSADHRAFMEAVEAAGLAEVLSGIGPYTVFAPVDAAFDAIPGEARARLMAADERDRLIRLISYHIVSGTVTAEDLARAIERAPEGRAELATVTGGNLSLWREGEAVLIGDGAGARARLVGPDQVHANGVVHSIDAVLMPAAG